jgi:hypothetical protein
VISPCADIPWCCMEEGVVGFVEFVPSEGGWLVEGVSGRGIAASAGDGSSMSRVAAWISGSETGSADKGVAGFLFLRARRAGHERSGLENQGNYAFSDMSRVERGRELTGALKGDLDVSSGGGDVGATFNAVCGIGGVMDPGIVCDE